MTRINLTDFDLLIISGSERSKLTESGYIIRLKDLNEKSNLLLEIIPETIRKQKELATKEYKDMPESKEKTQTINISVISDNLTELKSLDDKYSIFITDAGKQIIDRRLAKNWGLTLDHEPLSRVLVG